MMMTDSSFNSGGGNSPRSICIFITVPFASKGWENINFSSALCGFITDAFLIPSETGLESFKQDLAYHELVRKLEEDYLFRYLKGLFDHYGIINQHVLSMVEKVDNESYMLNFTRRIA